MIPLLVLLLHSAAISTGAAISTCVQNTTYPSFLPSSLTPTHYNLHLTFPDPNDAVLDKTSPLQFTAIVSVNVTVNTPTSCIVVHAGKFNYTSITLDGVEIGDTATVSGDLLTIHASSQNSPLTPGDQRMVIFKYVGYVRDDIDPDTDAKGVFLSPNTVPPPTPPGTKSLASSLATSLASWRLHRAQRPRQLRRRSERKYKHTLRASRQAGDPMMIATQFEQSEARNMFPSWDEPAYKATFDATIVVPTGLQVFFNTAELKKRSGTTTTNFTFKVTKHPLPTYLVALAIGHFDTLEKVSRDVRYRIITPVGYSSWATLALNASIHAAEWFGDKYGLPYSEMNEKMDSISVAGIDMDAMENQGLLTYSPQMLLLNPDATQLPPAPCGEWGRFGQAQLIMLVTTHEVHHMHFGDTVTMRDWTQEYLNEGFTRFAQYYGMDDLVKNFDMTCLTGRSQGARTNFYQFSYEVAMTFDTPGTAPSIVYPIRGGGDIPSFPPTAVATAATAATAALDLDPTKQPLFARIFYEKGASVNRMIATMLGWEEWFVSLSKELKRHTWQNPTVEDMMRSLDDSFVSMGLPTAVDAMLPWLRRPGYPIITLSVVNATTLVARQTPVSKYLKNQDPWWIPLQVGTSNDARPSLLSFNTTMATMEFAAPVAGLVGDPFFWGFFIVRYESDVLWNSRILSAIKTHKKTPDYTRELLFQITMLVNMSHEKAQRLSDAISAVTPILASNPRLGGWEGESGLYEMIIKITTPIVAVLGACGRPCIVAHARMSTVLRTMLSDLARRLTWEEEAPPVPVAGRFTEASVPWPTKEDAGMAARDESVLRPLVLLNAVIYNDPDTVKQGIAMFRNSSAAGGTVQSSFARAAYFAAAKYGSDKDRSALISLLASARGTDVADVLFGLTASASSTNCNAALALIPIQRDPKSMIVQMLALTDMLTYATDCHESLVPVVIALADEMWRGTHGQDATHVVKVALNHFSTSAGLQQATSLCKRHSQYISSSDAHAVEVNILINIDAAKNNIVL